MQTLVQLNMYSVYIEQYSVCVNNLLTFFPVTQSINPCSSQFDILTLICMPMSRSSDRPVVLVSHAYHLHPKIDFYLSMQGKVNILHTFSSLGN